MKKLLFFLIFLFSIEVYSQELPSDLPEELIEEIKLRTNDSDNSNQPNFQDYSIDEKDENEQKFNMDMENEIFGIDFIRSIPKSISATSDLPVPNDYVISLNDELKVILSGSKKNIYNLVVGLDGTILFPELGMIQVAGESFVDVKDKLKRLISSSYIGVELDISLSSLAAKKINVLGAVKMPGTYLVNPFTTISNALAYSGGIEEHSSLRNIILIRGNQRFTFDLYDLLIFGDRSEDLNVESGDTILVNATGNHVEISGEVFRPMIYEYAKDDSFGDLINFALGFNADAESGNMTATLLESGRSYSLKTELDDMVGSKKLLEIFVGRQVRIEDKNLFVRGSGVTSGYYPTSGENFSELLGKLKFSSDIYPFYATYKNISANGLIRNISSFSLSDPSSYYSLPASKNTELNFFSRDQILGIDDSLDEAFKEINQDDLISVSFPDRSIKIPVKGKISPKQIHAFFESVSEIDLKKVSIVTSEESFTDIYEDFFNAEDLVAISFPSTKNENLIEVSIQGEVLNPGTYLVASSTTLSDLYTLAGGLRSNAFERGISLFREDVKQRQIKAIREAKSILTDTMIQKSNSVSTAGMVDIEAVLQLADLVEPSGRVAGEFYEDSESSDEFLLKDKDFIFVPSMSYEIVVQGEVLNSSSFIFDESMSYKDYIQAAGGFSDYADKRAVFVIKANGLSVISGNNIFSGQAKIEPGDTIVVPRNLDQLEALPMVSMATKIIADIAFSAASLNAIQD